MGLTNIRKLNLELSTYDTYDGELSQGEGEGGGHIMHISPFKVHLYIRVYISPSTLIFGNFRGGGVRPPRPPLNPPVLLNTLQVLTPT